jgi:hypothetical protein
MQGELCEFLTGMLGELERPTGTLGEPSGGTPTRAAWIALVNHPEPFGVTVWGQVWGILAPAFSPGLDSKRLDFFFDAAFFFLPTGNFPGESPAISVFYSRLLVNDFHARAHMD